MNSFSDYEEDNNNKTNENDFFVHEEESEDIIKFLKKHLLKNNIYNIYKTYISNNNNLMELTEESANQDEINIGYFKNKEEISEVKINMFFILSKDFRKDNDKYKDFIDDNNNIKIQRLIIQNFTKNENTINFGPNQYFFISIKKNQCFDLNENDKIKIEKYSISYNSEKLFDEDTFVDKYKFGINKKTDELISDIDYAKLKDNDNKSKKSKSGDSSKTISNKGDQSDNETNGKVFFKINEINSYTRFYYLKYTKEIDGIYDYHQEIQLNKSEKIELKKGIKDLVYNYDNNNDLKSGIIYKNFEGSTIKADEPLILEIKSGFNLIDLFEQIKHSSKIFNNYKDKNSLRFPKTAIGIICNYNSVTCSNEMERLDNNYKDTKITYLEHITDIIYQNNFNVVISVIKDGKISDYSILDEDWKIKNHYERVNLRLMNEKLNIGKSEADLKLIINNYQKKYKSLTFIQSIKMNKHQEEMEKIENKYKNEINKQKEQISVQANEINKQRDQISVQASKIEEQEKTINQLYELIKRLKGENK